MVVGGIERTVQHWAGLLRTAKRTGWVLEVEGDVSAFVAVEHLSRPRQAGDVFATVEIAFLIVDNAFQRRGYGAILAEAAIAELGQSGSGIAIIDVEAERVGAIAFWNSQGWTTRAEESNPGSGESSRVVLTRTF
jgi:ribosomal protein S18 acetylase RimI-like enzyme